MFHATWLVTFRHSPLFGRCWWFYCSTAWTRTFDSLNVRSTFCCRWWIWSTTPGRRPTWTTSTPSLWLYCNIELIQMCTSPQPSRWSVIHNLLSSSRNPLTKFSTTTSRFARRKLTAVYSFHVFIDIYVPSNLLGRLKEGRITARSWSAIRSYNYSVLHGHGTSATVCLS